MEKFAEEDSQRSASHSLLPFGFDEGIKVLSNSSNLKSIPSKFQYSNEPSALSSDSIPVVDFSMLTSIDHDQRSRAIDDLGKACKEWGFFIVRLVNHGLTEPSLTPSLVNHGVPETLMKAMFGAIKEFLNLPESEKRQYEAKHVSDPIKCGNFKVTNASNQIITLWREYLKCYVHPDFHCPLKTQVLREVIQEYSEKTRNIARILVNAISEDLGLDELYTREALKLDTSFQLFAANFYPLCPQPDQAIGLPPHTDHGFFSLLMHNGVAGLQILHDGEWFNADSPQNSILVNAADQLQIFSNGKYKSVKHRAVVNDQKERISVVTTNGPSFDTIVGPAQPILEKDGRALYRSMKYGEYIESQLTSAVNLEQMMIQEES